MGVLVTRVLPFGVHTRASGFWKLPCNNQVARVLWLSRRHVPRHLQSVYCFDKGSRSELIPYLQPRTSKQKQLLSSKRGALYSKHSNQKNYAPKSATLNLKTPQSILYPKQNGGVGLQYAKVDNRFLGRLHLPPYFRPLWGIGI